MSDSDRITCSVCDDVLGYPIEGEGDPPFCGMCGEAFKRGAASVLADRDRLREECARAVAEVERLKTAAGAWRDHRLSQTGNKRFFIDHGVIHDRQTGKHVRAHDPVTEEDGIEECCALLNRLADEQFTDDELRGYLIADDVRQQLAAAIAERDEAREAINSYQDEHEERLYEACDRCKDQLASLATAARELVETIHANIIPRGGVDPDDEPGHVLVTAIDDEIGALLSQLSALGDAAGEKASAGDAFRQRDGGR